MRTIWIGLLALVLAVGVLVPSTAHAADSKFELYGSLTHAQMNMTLKMGGNEEKHSSPGYGIQLGGRYWLRPNLAVGILGDWVQDRVTSKGVTEWDFHTGGVLGAISYRFVDGERVGVIGTAGAGPYRAKIKSGGDSIEFRNSVGFAVGLEVRAKLTDQATLNGHLGYRSVNLKETKDGPDAELSSNAFTLGVGLSYNF